jgi:hypothetical protein
MSSAEQRLFTAQHPTGYAWVASGWRRLGRVLMGGLNAVQAPEEVHLDKNEDAYAD